MLEEKDSWLLWQVINHELENPVFPEEKKDKHRAILLHCLVGALRTEITDRLGEGVG